MMDVNATSSNRITMYIDVGVLQSELTCRVGDLLRRIRQRRADTKDLDDCAVKDNQSRSD